ncbi:unnamed protein product, partial [marine sediment metagenome]
MVSAENPETVCPAIKSPAAIVVFIIIAAASLVSDLASKQSVFDSMLADPASQDRLAKAKAYHPQMTAREALGFFHKTFCPG